MQLDQYSQEVSKHLNYLNRNIAIAEQIIESIQTMKEQNKQIPTNIILAFNQQLGQIKQQQYQFNQLFLDLKQKQEEFSIKQEQLTKINNAIKQFERRIEKIEQRQPTVTRTQQQNVDQTNDSDITKTKTLNQLLTQINELKDEKKEEIDRLAKNAKLLNNAAGEFKEVLQQSVEKVDQLIDTTRDTKDSVKKVNTNIQQLTTEVKRDYFCWWLAVDLILLAILVTLIIFCFWGVPPQF